MKTTVDKSTPTHAKFTITVTPEELKPFIDGAYRTISEQIQVPGFRRGKVPNQIIDQRLGREVVIDQAVNDSLDRFYQQALAETGLQPLSQPQADVVETPDVKDLSGDLIVTVEVDVRPEVTLGEYKGLKLEVDPADVTDEDIEVELTALRRRFGTLKSVDRPLENGDFAVLDLNANIDGATVDEAAGLSYEVGSGELLDGIDDAILTLTAGEETTFNSTLIGGDHAGQDAEITVKVTAVKERELPEVDDDFAQLASEFDTVDELRDDLRAQATKKKLLGQVEQARLKAIDALIEGHDVPVPQQLIDDEVARHLENEGLAPDDKHGDQVRATAEKSFRQQVILDEIIKAEQVRVEQNEFTEFLIQQSAQYGIAPQQYVDALQESGQLPQVMGEVARSKAILYVLADANLTDTNGTPVDISEYTEVVRQARERQAQDAAAAAASEAQDAAAPATPATEAATEAAEAVEPAEAVDTDTADAKPAKAKSSKKASK